MKQLVHEAHEAYKEDMDTDTVSGTKSAILQQSSTHALSLSFIKTHTDSNNNTDGLSFSQLGWVLKGEGCLPVFILSLLWREAASFLLFCST